MLSEDKCWSLSRAGIGRKYHNMSVSEMGKMGERILDWSKENHSAVRSGKCLLVTGAGSRPVITMVARTLHLTGISMFLCDITELVSIHRGEVDEHEAYIDSDCLVLPSFQNEGECPLRARESFEVERIIRRRLDNHCSVFMGMPMKMAVGAVVSEHLTWWSDELTDDIKDFDRIDAGNRI